MIVTHIVIFQKSNGTCGVGRAFIENEFISIDPFEQTQENLYTAKAFAQAMGAMYKVPILLMDK